MGNKAWEPGGKKYEQALAYILPKFMPKEENISARKYKCRLCPTEFDYEIYKMLVPGCEKESFWWICVNCHVKRYYAKKLQRRRRWRRIFTWNPQGLLPDLVKAAMLLGGWWIIMKGIFK